MFKSFEDLLKYLKTNKDIVWSMYSADFDTAVSEEAAVLKSRDDAEYHYLNEINSFIEKPFRLTPMTLKGYRRKPTVFIVGTLIRNNLQKQGELCDTE